MQAQVSTVSVIPSAKPALTDDQVKRLEKAFRAARRLRDLRAALLLAELGAERARAEFLRKIDAAQADYTEAAHAAGVRS